MSYFHTPDTEEHAEAELRQPARSKFTELGGRVARWFAGLDDEREDWPTPEDDPLTALGSEIDNGPVAARPSRREAPPARMAVQADEDVPPRFALAPFGYNRVAVDEQLAALERELDELRSRHTPPMSITEELERIGEQTASILVVAHDTAHQTTRLAEEQAERCIADAASNALAITEKATRRLGELDEETDQVWSERERLLEDVRAVSAALTSLADQAEQRFPPESKSAPTGLAPSELARMEAAPTEPADTEAIDVMGVIDAIDRADADARTGWGTGASPTTD